jgi:hypothetical protein
MSPINYGENDYSNARFGDLSIVGAYRGSDPIIAYDFPPVGELVSVSNWVGTGVSGFQLETQQRSSMVMHIAGGGPQAGGFGIPYFCINAYPNNLINRNYWRIDSSTSGSYFGFDGNFIVEFGSKWLKYGDGAGLNSPDYNDLHAIGFRWDEQRDLSAGGDLTSFAHCDEGVGLQHVIYYGNGTGSQTIAHGCNAVPQLYFLKGLADNRNMLFGGPLLTAVSPGNTYGGLYDGSYGGDSFDFTNYTATTISTGSSVFQNWNSGSSDNSYSLQLFYDVEGSVKTGTVAEAGGSTFTVECGFEPSWIFLFDSTAGARRILVKNNGLIGPAYEAFWSGSDNGAAVSSDYTITATGFTINDGVIGNDNTNTLGYVAIKG